MLMLELMTEAAKRYGSGPGWGAVVGDAGDQARHGMDAPDTVEDGVEWFADDDDPDVCGAVPRLVELREPPNVGGNRLAPTTGATMNDTIAGASPVDQPVRRHLPKRYEGGRIKGGCSLHDAEKPELCQKHLQRCPEPRTVDCCGVVDEHDIIECSRCGKQWTVPCNFDEDYS